MKIVQGEYKDGVIRLLEEVTNVGNTKVLITFLDEHDLEESFDRQLSHRQPAEFINDYLSDEREDLYKEFLKEKDDNR